MLVRESVASRRCSPTPAPSVSSQIGKLSSSSPERCQSGDDVSGRGGISAGLNAGSVGQRPYARAGVAGVLGVSGRAESHNGAGRIRACHRAGGDRSSRRGSSVREGEIRNRRAAGSKACHRYGDGAAAASQTGPEFVRKVCVATVGGKQSAASVSCCVFPLCELLSLCKFCKDAYSPVGV